MIIDWYAFYQFTHYLGFLLCCGMVTNGSFTYAIVGIVKYTFSQCVDGHSLIFCSIPAWICK